MTRQRSAICVPRSEQLQQLREELGICSAATRRGLIEAVRAVAYPSENYPVAGVDEDPAEALEERLYERAAGMETN